MYLTVYQTLSSLDIELLSLEIQPLIAPYGKSVSYTHLDVYKRQVLNSVTHNQVAGGFRGCGNGTVSVTLERGVHLDGAGVCAQLGLHDGLAGPQDDGCPGPIAQHGAQLAVRLADHAMGPVSYTHLTHDGPGVGGISAGQGGLPGRGFQFHARLLERVRQLRGQGVDVYKRQGH